MIKVIIICSIFGAFAGVVYANVREQRDNAPQVIPAIGMTVPQGRRFLAEHGIAVPGYRFSDAEVVEVLTLWKQGRGAELNNLQARYRARMNRAMAS